ncbi:stanniocalcin-like [Etheostoma spectabile]|uniref:stanniocalcin-like n=1 Tax=Etheostoma spectabile TaxID=54343 RepID=UPI0013AF6893|nr:stanniocalcin-like [Etheostoma spectabile]
MGNQKNGVKESRSTEAEKKKIESVLFLGSGWFEGFNWDGLRRVTWCPLHATGVSPVPHSLLTLHRLHVRVFKRVNRLNPASDISYQRKKQLGRALETATLTIPEEQTTSPDEESAGTWSLGSWNNPVSPQRVNTGPSDVARCLSGAVSVGCGFFSCLENSTCDTDGMHELCELFLHSAASFNTEVSLTVSHRKWSSLHTLRECRQPPGFSNYRRCTSIPMMIADVQEECYSSLDICTWLEPSPTTIGEWCQVPTHFPNRYYSTLLQALQACDEQTVAAVKTGVMARLGPDMETFLQLVQNKPCASDAASAAYSNPSSWRNMPVFNVQPGFKSRDPTHLFARKRSVDDTEGRR